MFSLQTRLFFTNCTEKVRTLIVANLTPSLEYSTFKGPEKGVWVHLLRGFERLAASSIACCIYLSAGALFQLVTKIQNLFGFNTVIVQIL
jgi:hypothetical protein